jgi:VIT1/CCC1 family predicted Fe2+/Mn2+ transporter
MQIFAIGGFMTRNSMPEKKSEAFFFMKILKQYLPDVIYGGNDGIVTSFAVISGVEGARLSVEAMIIIAVVNLLADGFSMAASNFSAIRSLGEVQGISRGSVEPTLHALATFLAFIIFGSMPVLGFLLASIIAPDPFLISALITGCTLFLLGAIRSLVSHRRWYSTGMETLAIGVTASLVAYFCGKFMASLVR